MSDSQQAALPLPDLPGIGQGWEMLQVDEPEVRGRYTADKLERLQGLRDGVLRMLAEGRSIRETAHVHGISTNLVLAASRRYGPQIETLKLKVGADCLDVARLAIERARDDMHKMPMASLPILVDVMVRNAQLLTGKPTERIEHVESVAHADINALIESLPAAQPVREGEKTALKAGDVVLEIGGGEADAVGLGDGVPGRASDSSSPDFCPCSEESAEERADDGQIEGQKGGAA